MDTGKVVEIKGGTTITEYKGRRGVWAQGDCVFFEVEDAADACVQYRRDMTNALIGISTHPPCVDGLRVQALREKADAWDALVALLPTLGEWERGRVLAANGQLLVWVLRERDGR